jgi:hypothetical protein
LGWRRGGEQHLHQATQKPLEPTKEQAELVAGDGELKGTKYGISTASHPKTGRLMTRRQSMRPTSGRAPGCPDLPPRLAFAVFDAAVNNGVGRAVRWLQLAVGAAEDGSYGVQTKAAVERAVRTDPDDLKLGERSARSAHSFHGWPLRLVELRTWLGPAAGSGPGAGRAHQWPV